MGGGALLAPIMILFFRIPPVWAVGTDIAYSTVTKALGSIVHIRQKNDPQMHRIDPKRNADRDE